MPRRPVAFRRRSQDAGQVMTPADMLRLAESGGLPDLTADTDDVLDFLAWADDAGFDIPPTMCAADLVAVWRAEQE